MRLIRFMVSRAAYAVPLLLCLLVLAWLPYIATVYGTTYPWELTLCWCFAPVPLVGLMIGASVHRHRLHVRALERHWYDANHNMRTTSDENLQRLFLALRNNPEKW